MAETLGSEQHYHRSRVIVQSRNGSARCVIQSGGPAAPSPSTNRIGRLIPKDALVLDIVEAFGRDRDQPIGQAYAANGRSAGSDLRRPPSRFATLVELAESLDPTRSALLGVLLDACLDQGRGRAVLRPLWAEEAVHRAHVFVRLLVAGNVRPGTADRTPLEAGIELVLARDLASLLKLLETANEMAILPTARILRDVTRDLDALFGTVAGEVTLCTDIASVALPGYKRRALVLAVVELVANALLHGFRGRPGGRIEVTLNLLGPALAGLRVTDDGVGFTAHPPGSHIGIAGALADLLEGEFAYARIRGRTTAAIVFPA